MNKKYTRKRSQRLKHTYGINVSQWNRLFTLQGGICPICLKPLRKPGNKDGKRAACVDHDHGTTRGIKHRVRGLLCYFCNKYRVSNNTPDTAERMVAYLASDVDGRTL